VATGELHERISSYEVARDLGVRQESAWFMTHRIRLALQAGHFGKLAGEIEADETYVGGTVPCSAPLARSIAVDESVAACAPYGHTYLHPQPAVMRSASSSINSGQPSAVGHRSDRGVHSGREDPLQTVGRRASARLRRSGVSTLRGKPEAAR